MDYTKKIKKFIYKTFLEKPIDYKILFDINTENWIENKKLAICIGFNPWKRIFFNEYIKGYNTAYVRGKTHHNKVINALKNIKEEYEVFIWSYKEDPKTYEYLSNRNIKIHRVEDGFIRSIGLGSNKVEPLSIIIDNDSIYFNPKKKSKLEEIIQSKLNKFTDEEIQSSKETIKLIIENKISKYNFRENFGEVDSIIDSNKKNILVIGQVEDDISIKLGCSKKISNMDLLKVAYKENPNANIIFKPHPDILEQNRENSHDISDYELIAKTVPNGVNLHDVIDKAEHVYTITSLSGFEALLRGKKVTCLGSPFYSHYGLTDDRDEAPMQRKNIKLSIEELFYCSYILYPKYLNKDINKTIKDIISEKTSLPKDFYKQNQFYNNNFEEIQNLSCLKDKTIALITGNSDIYSLYHGLAYFSKHTDIFTVSHNVEKIIKEKRTIPSQNIKFIVKYALEPLNHIENSSVDLAQNISKKYNNILIKILSGLFNFETTKSISSILSDDFEDTIYNKCVTYYTLLEILNNHDYILFYLSDNDLNTDLLNLVINHENNSKIIITTKKQMPNINLIKKINSNIKPAINFNYNNKKSIDDIKIILKKEWNSRIYNSNLQHSYSDNPIIVCSHLINKTYAYYPSAEEIIKIATNKNINLKLLPHSILNFDLYNEYKHTLFEITGGKNDIEILPFLKKDLLTRNNNLGIIISNKIIPKTINLLKDSLYQSLPNEICNYLFSTIENKKDNLAIYLSFYFESIKILQNSKLFITTMERTTFSRLMTVSAQEYGIETIGIQGVFISTSRRYRKPIVDKMLVANELQEENFINLGYEPHKIEKVGSANLRKHLTLINECEISNSFDKSKIKILFIMQHSMTKIMEETIVTLLNIIDSKIELYIKPHPHQETSIISKINKEINSYDNVKLLEPNDNTYFYMKNCDVTVGLFSNAVYEAILANKDVIVLKNKELHPSIDFSRFNTCFIAKNDNELKNWLTLFKSEDNQVLKIRNNRNKYIENNSYIFNTDKLKKTLNLDYLKDNNE